MKWVVVIIVVILVAPTVARRLEALDPDKRDNPPEPATVTDARRRGIAYRAVRRFGPRTVLIASVLILLVLVVVAYVLIRKA